jgi:hypothetical protein
VRYKMATAQEILDSIAPIEENRQSLLDRAAEWRAKGREDRAKTWDASAARYARLIEIKKDLHKSAENIAAIKARITAIPKTTEGVPGGPPKFTPPTTATPSSGTPLVLELLLVVLQGHLHLLLLIQHHQHHLHHHLHHLHHQLKQHQ